MSTSGVTLMPETMSSSETLFAPALAPPRLCHAGAAGPGRLALALVAREREARAGARLGLEEPEQHVRQRVRVPQDPADRPLEVVVGSDGGQRDGEADRGGDERLGDAAHHVGRRSGSCRGRGVAARLAELVERHHDTDDGPEQTDERRVVAERAEERDALLVTEALLFDRGGLVLLDGGGAIRGVLETHARDRGFHRARALQHRERGGGALGRQRAQRGGDQRARRPLLHEEPDALRDHSDRCEREAEHQPQHPARARAEHEIEKLGVDRCFVGHRKLLVRTGHAGRRSATRSESFVPR